jgi:hypothetical protein
MAHQSQHPRRTGAWVLVTILVIIAVAGTLVVPIYARSTPALGSFPFFYWYQLLWVPVVAILSWIGYLLTRPAAPVSAAPGAAAVADAGPDDSGRAL